MWNAYSFLTCGSTFFGCKQIQCLIFLSVSGLGMTQPGLLEVWGAVHHSPGAVWAVFCAGLRRGHFYRLLAELFLEVVAFAAVCFFSDPIEGESPWQGLSVKLT